VNKSVVMGPENLPPGWGMSRSHIKIVASVWWIKAD